MKKVELLIFRWFERERLFPIIPAWGEGNGRGLSHINFTLAALQDFSIYQSFHLKVIFRCWAAFRRGHHVSGIERWLRVFYLFIFMKKRGGIQVFKPGGGGFQLLTCTRLRARTQAPAVRLDQHADLLCLRARDAAAAGGAGSPHRVSLSCRLHNSLHWGGQEALPALKIHRGV